MLRRHGGSLSALLVTCLRPVAHQHGRICQSTSTVNPSPTFGASYCVPLLLQVDNRSQDELMVTAEQAVALCDRNFGIGGDGVRPRNCSAHRNKLTWQPVKLSQALSKRTRI